MELIAQRIGRWAKLVGRENVMAGTLAIDGLIEPENARIGATGTRAIRIKRGICVRWEPDAAPTLSLIHI